MRLPTILRKIRSLIVLTVVSLFLFFMACERKQPGIECFNYPKQIDSLQIRDLYDTARLYLFTWLCDREFDNYYRGQFELKYKSFFMQNDSIELFFSHSLPKKPEDPNSGSGDSHVASIAFNIKTKQKLWGWDINGFSDALQPGNPRFESAASKEVLDFIKIHKSIMDPCFLALAEKTNLVVK